MSIKNGAQVSAQFIPTAALVDNNGIPTTSYGRGFLQSLFTRTGLGTGIQPIVSPPLAATGSGIATALQLIADWNQITSGTGGVAIAAALNLQPGNDIWVFNSSGVNQNVYPPNAQTQIDTLGAGSPYVLANGKLRCFQCWTSTQFHSYGN